MAVLNDPVTMRGLLLTYTEKVLVLEEQVEGMKPKVVALERIAIAGGSLNLTEAAKALQQPPEEIQPAPVQPALDLQACRRQAVAWISGQGAAGAG